MLDHASVPRCVTETLRRVEGTWIMVCLTCPTFRGHNARGRTYVSHAEASMAGRDHARAKLRYRIHRAAWDGWIGRLIAAPDWVTYSAVASERLQSYADLPEPRDWRVTQSALKVINKRRLS